MTRWTNNRNNASRLVWPAFLAVASVLLLMSLAASFDSISAQLLIIGVTAAVAAGLLIGLTNEVRPRLARQERLLATLRTPMALVSEPELFSLHNDLSRSFISLGKQSDAVLRELAMLKLFSVNEDVKALASGRVVFTATESWRKVYEKILRTPGLRKYQSVAVVRTEDYWRDIPGERSMQLNFELLRQGVTIDRILVINDFLWPPGAAVPAKGISQWIDRQHEQGVKMYLVRESELLSEAELLTDFGIYGDCATGVQELDNEGRTHRFILEFGQQSINLARDRWQRLSVYAVAYDDLLQQSKPRK